MIPLHSPPVFAILSAISWWRGRRDATNDMFHSARATMRPLFRAGARCSARQPWQQGKRAPGGGGSGRASSSGGGGGGGAKGPWARYLELLETNPLATKAITSGVISGAGDWTCQAIYNEEGAGIDWARLGKFSLLGAALVGPTLHVWYGLLGRLLPKPGTLGAVQRLVADQFVFAPTFIPVFMSTLMALDGQAASIVEKLKADWFEAVKGNWALWIPAQFINFRLVPPHLQVLFANVVGVAWNVYLSLVSHREVPSAAAAAAVASAAGDAAGTAATA